MPRRVKLCKNLALFLLIVMSLVVLTIACSSSQNDSENPPKASEKPASSNEVDFADYEQVARAAIEAYISGDCQRFLSYWDPTLVYLGSDDIKGICSVGRSITVRIDNVVVVEPHAISFVKDPSTGKLEPIGPMQAKVVFEGEFGSSSELSVSLEETDGKWYIATGQFPLK